jgi:hypothetical protein
MVHVGFLSAWETNCPASTTNRFLHSWACAYLLRTEVVGSLPILVVPTSWIIRAGSVETIIRFRTRFVTDQGAPHCCQNLLESVVHMLCLLQFMLTPGVVKSQYGNPELINSVRINFAVIIVTGYTLTRPEMPTVEPYILRISFFRPFHNRRWERDSRIHL